MSIDRIEIEAERVVLEELETAKRRIIENHIAAGQRVTGTTADSIVVTAGTIGDLVEGMIDARECFAALETGTRPWSAQHVRYRKDGSTYPSAPKWFVDIIRQWAEDKQLSITSPWGIATKIMTDGSKLFREGGREDIFSNEIPLLLDRIANRLAGLFDAQITESIARQKP